MKRIWVAMVCLLMGAAVQAQAQDAATATAAKTLRFEVISIKRNVGPPMMGGVGSQQAGPTADGFHLLNLPLIGLFQVAYAPSADVGFLRGNQISGGPEWLQGNDNRYDVVAKVAPEDLQEWQSSPKRQQEMMREMVRGLLEDRMKVAVHWESKEAPGYELHVGKEGPKFKAAATTEDAELKTSHPEGTVAPGGAMVANSPDNPRVIRLYAVPMTMLAGVLLSNMTGKPVVDKTGLAGRYDLTVEMPNPEGGESLFTMVQEQLGLRLEAAKVTLQTLVIDHAERPTEN